MTTEIEWLVLMVNALIAAPLLTVLIAAGLYLAGISPWFIVGILLFGAPVIILLAMGFVVIADRICARAFGDRYRSRKSDRASEADR